MEDWEAARGEVAVFRWVEWLRENTLATVLGGESALVLDATGGAEDGIECAPHQRRLPPACCCGALPRSTPIGVAW